MKTTKQTERRHYARRLNISEFNRTEIIDRFKQGQTCREISRAMQLNETTISLVIDNAIMTRELITDITRYMPNPTFKPRDYSDADEYTRHFAGAELEDTRNAVERETEQAHPYRYRGIYGKPF